jgi:hypothetical protein
MITKENKWIAVKAFLIAVSACTAPEYNAGPVDPTSYPFVAVIPVLFFGLGLPWFLRQCESTARYETRALVWRAAPFLVGTGPLPFYDLCGWVSLAAGLVGLPHALLTRRDLGTPLFALSSGVGCLWGISRTIKRNGARNLEQAARHVR